MRHQVWEPNSGLITRIGIFTKFKFYQVNWMKSKWNCRKLSVNGKLRVKLHKSKVRIEVKKVHKFKAAIKVLARIKLHKIKSLKSIKSNYKSRDQTILVPFWKIFRRECIDLWCEWCRQHIAEVEEVTHHCTQWLAEESSMSL